MSYTVKSTEQTRKSGSDCETKALLYLMNFREDSDEIHYFVVDFFNDLTGMDRFADNLWDVQSKAAKNNTPAVIGRELVTLYKNYLSDFEFKHYIVKLSFIKIIFELYQFRVYLIKFKRIQKFLEFTKKLPRFL